MGDETDMNYIREINAFYDWLETNHLSVSAMSLWYALMHINNKTGWANEFTVALSVLSIKSGLSSRAVTNARKELTEIGRITWESRDGNQSAKYRINSLAEELQELYADNTTNKVADKHTDNASDNTTTLNKHKQKQNENYKTLHCNADETKCNTDIEIDKEIKLDTDKKKKGDKKESEYSPEFLKWYSEYPRPQSKADSFKNFEKVRKTKGIDYIWKCTRNYIDYFHSLPEEKREFAYSSNNFFGQKMYCEDFEVPKAYKMQTSKPTYTQPKLDGSDDRII